MTNIEELQDAIKQVHGVDSKHIESVPVHEEYQGQTVWKGVVEVFALFGHPKASQAYAWSHETDGNKKRHITVLALHPVVSAADAVRAAILQDYKNATAEED